MRRMTKVLIGLLATLLLTAGALWLFWWYQITLFEPFQQSEPVEGMTPESETIARMTAKNAYAAAEPVAQGWAKDATLLSVRATWEPGADIQSGEGDWTAVFYSPEQDATVLISVVDSKATLINVRKADRRPDLQDVEVWQIDSPDIVNKMLIEGGGEFLRSQPGAVLVLSLNLDGQGGWKGRLIHKETRRTFAVQLGADTGEIVAVQQSG